MLNDAINVPVVPSSRLNMDKGTMHEMPKNDNREPRCTFMYRALAILKLNITFQRFKVVAYL